MVDGKYDEHLLSTIGVDFKFRRVKVGKEEIKLQIWDTAGTTLLSGRTINIPLHR